MVVASQNYCNNHANALIKYLVSLLAHRELKVATALGMTAVIEPLTRYRGKFFSLN